MRYRAIACFMLVCAPLAGCRREAVEPAEAVRLVDLYGPENLRGGAQPAHDVPRTEWRFERPQGRAPQEGPRAGTLGWEAGPGVQSLAIRDGRLTGVTTGDFPVIHLERTTGLDDKDRVHALEVRMSVSAGATIACMYSGDEKLDLAKAVEGGRELPWFVQTDLRPGDQVRSHLLLQRRGVSVAETRHILIRVTDVAGAKFSIESVRLITRREHLAAIASGVSWQGLSEVYRETLVARSPETIAVPVAMPAAAWLDLSLGTLEGAPVTFRVGVDGGTGSSRTLLERTLTTPQRWESVSIDLSEWSGRRAGLSLSLVSAEPGAIGLWGSPVVRGRRQTPERPDDPPRGVILIWADTLRSDHLPMYGYRRDTSPALQRLASEGTLFRKCISQATWTKVATPSLMTSLYPTSHTVKEFSDRLPAAARTLAEVYRDAGYATLSMSSILFTGSFSNLHQGYEELHEDTSLSDQRSSKTAREYVDRLLPWLETHRDVPFFVFLHVSDPHDPYRPYAPYDTIWADAAGIQAHEKQAEDVRRFITEPLMKRFGMPSRAELQRAGFDADAYVAFDRDWYDGSILAMDAEIDRLVERLRELRLDRSTLVVFAADHGEEFLEHGRTFHGQTVYGELTDVPLLLWSPGRVPSGVTVDGPVRIIDVMPTLLELSRLTGPAEMQGRSLLPLLSMQGAASREAGPHARAGATGPGLAAAVDGDRSGEPETPPAVTEKLATSPTAGAAPPPHETESHSIVLDGWKLIHNTRRPAGAPEFELYAVAADPLDREDVAASHPDVVQRLAARLDRWRAESQAARLKPDSESAGSLSAEELERLRSLGYIQ